MCQQEASLASITCSLIIIRSEEVVGDPETLLTSLPAVASAVPSVTEKYSKNPDGVFTPRSMEVVVDVARAVDENV